MSNTPLGASILQHVFHPSDFSEASETAFAHALKAALVAKAALTILHVSPGGERDWTEFPGVRQTLERWGILPRNSPKSAVPELGINVRKIIAKDKDPVKSVLAFLDHEPTDLIVLATQQDKGRVRWLANSVAQPVARKSRQMTLFIPAGVKGFVSLQNGSVSLKNILIPIAPVPSPQPAIHAAVRIAQRLNCPAGRFTILHVGDESAMPEVSCPDVPGWEWKKLSQQGDITPVILETARATEADLIVMSTEGRDGFLDALRGSHSEQVLRQCACPLLAIPAQGWVASVL
ncbi:MAG TPA: universal stress protein [Nitrospiraceae bacterium]|nr:universal stress protein [Nitrospiraceae bacterium]